MIIIVHAGLSIYQKINVCVRSLESKNLDGVIVDFTANIRSDILIRIFEGELGREKHIAFNDDDDVWEVINVLHDYPNHEMNVFVKRYMWPDER